MFTLGNWVLLGFLLFVGIFVTIISGTTFDSASAWVISGLISIIIIVGIMAAIGWYNTNTAAGQRAVKDYHSNINNGIDREITITAEDGREIFHYEGKVDVESNHDDNYIKFESEEGKRYIIYYGIQDTIKIIER